MSEIEETSHLSTLIARVREDEQQFGYATKEHLINVAEYLISWPSKYSQEEYSQAIRVLAQYHLAKLANLSPRRRIMTQRLINRELAKPYKARCRRCGLPISNTVSLQAGYGQVCRRKLGISSNLSKTDRHRERFVGPQLIKNFSEKEGLHDE